jgi:23S rRNA pseudouridine2605 synthase
MKNNSTQNSTRLNKYLALEMGVSRREADNLIASGRVAIDNSIASLGSQVFKNSTVSVDGKNIKASTDFKYLSLNKPIGYVCSRKQQGSNQTIYSLLPAEYHTLKPVGRLDKDTSGIILLTNDGDFAHQMTHPSFYKIKVYQATLDKDLQPLHQQMINDYGITLDDGPSKLNLERISDSNRKSWNITMHEGRNRQIRRTFSALGYEVVKLHRSNFGNYSLGDIKQSDYQIINIH